MTSPTVLLSAGEPSSDLHGAAVARALRERWPDVRLFGLGGPRMAAEGVELLADLDRLAVMGFTDVVGSLPFFFRLMRRLRRELLARPADLVLPIDYPGFNLRLARTATRAGVPVLYYIAPQVWAWHRSRLRDLARYTDLLAVVLPFEEPFFREAGARVSFVGHPLLDDPPVRVTRAEFCDGLALDPARPILALFPGSRAKEVERHLPVFVATAERVRQRRPDVQPVIAASVTVPAGHYEAAPYPRTTESRVLLAHAHTALVKSGTTTLETALAGVPMVIVYRTDPVSFWLARRLVEVDHIGLVNLVAAKRVAPEYLQSEATPEALTGALLPLLDDGSEARETTVRELERVRRVLGGGTDAHGTAASRVAELAADLLSGRR